MRSLYVGIAPARDGGRTGLAALEQDGTLVETATLDADDEIVAWLEALPGGVAVAAVDAPLLAPEAAGGRPGDVELGRAFEAFGITARRPGTDPGRATRLAARFGWTTAPTNRGSADWPACIEVSARAAGAALPELRPEADHPAEVGAAIVCAHLARLWHEEPGALRVYGDREDGYLIAPPPPPAPAETDLHVEVDPAEVDAVRAAIAAVPGVLAVHPAAPRRLRADDEVR